MELTDPHAQTGFDVRLDWGASGLVDTALDVAAVVVVDVLSFTTAVEIACSQGAHVYPGRSTEDEPTVVAPDVEVVEAVRRSDVSAEHPYSLSPATLRDIPPRTSLLLSSPNGAEVTLAAGAIGVPVFAACLRNRTAVAQVVEGLYPLAVIAAGERRGDGSLRPAWEDLIGAGALIDLLLGSRSPESELAVAGWRSVRDLPAEMARCASGRELNAGGFADDLTMASQIDVSDGVPMLDGGCYRTRE